LFCRFCCFSSVGVDNRLNLSLIEHLSIQFQCGGWACHEGCLKYKFINSTTNERKEYGAEDRYSWEPQKKHLTGEFVIIVEKFGGHALCHLASKLANVIRQGGRLKTYFLKIHINKLLQLLHSFMYYIWFSNVKAV